MNTTRLKDCYVRIEGETVIVGNALIERRMTHHGLATDQIIDKVTGYAFRNTQNDVVLMQNLPFRPHQADISYEADVDDQAGLSQESLALTIRYAYEGGLFIREFYVYPNLAYIQQKARIQGRTAAAGTAEALTGITGVESRDSDETRRNVVLSVPDAVDAFVLPNAHFTMRSARFYDQTDRNDFLITEEIRTLYRRGRCMADGNLFFIHDKYRDQSLVIFRDAPTHLGALNRGECDLTVHLAQDVLQVQVLGSGLDRTGPAEEELPLYGSGVGVSRGGGEERLCRDAYRAQYKGQPEKQTFIMSNTWGDRNQDAAVCQDFMAREAEVAAALGVDIVQIDDGWQHGVTSNSKRRPGGVWEGYYAQDGDFWQVDLEKFPQGLVPISRSLSERKMILGLWFSPDSSNDFENWERDVETLTGLYREIGVRYFKLDGVKIRSKYAEKRYLQFMRSLLMRSGNAIYFNQDITAERRLGYFYEKQLGTLFVENRYTDWGNYFPHNTLKNLWMLSRYIPANKFQFEVLNHRRNPGKYAGDPFAPSHYDIDYLFACVMLANPLVWMEMSHLAAEDVARLREIIAVYQGCRAAFFAADISPIGERPDGQAFTGFHVQVSAREGYFLLFRELTEGISFAYSVAALAGKRLEFTLLVSNAPSDAVRLEASDGFLRATIDRPRSYALVRYAVT